MPKDKYPSITEIINKTKTKEQIYAIDQWRRKNPQVGDKVANFGTQTHKVIHESITGKNPHIPNSTVMNHFLNFYPYVNKIGKTLGSELFMKSHKLKVQGKADFIGYYNGIPSIVEFKTKLKPIKLIDLYDAFCQCAAYSILYQENNHTEIPQLIVITSVHGSKESQEFIEPLTNYAQKLKDRVKTYYLTNNLK